MIDASEPPRYTRYVEQGWNAIAAPTEFGGQGLPFALGVNVLTSRSTVKIVDGAEHRHDQEFTQSPAIV